MNTLDLLAGIQARRQELDNLPNEERESARAQIAEIATAITKGNAQLLAAIKALPEAKDHSKDIIDAIKGIEIPQDDSNIINALKSLESQNVALLKAIKSLDVSPEVKVAAPVVNVPETDLKPVIEAIKESKPEPTTVDLSSLEKLMRDSIKASTSVKTAINNLVFPVSNTPTDPLIYYLAADIDDAAGSTGIQYFGYTDNKGAWYIRKMDNSTSPKTIRLTFGQTNYTTNWANRAALTYTVWGG
jgi:hypothetical protein